MKKTLVDAMDLYGNPSSLHAAGRLAREAVEEVRERVAEFIGATPDEVIFAGSGSEANNTVLSIPTCASKGCDCVMHESTEVVTSAIEHPCILETANCLGERGVSVRYVGVDRYGRVDPEELRRTITGHTRLVSIMMANNEVGTIQEIKTLAAIAHEHGALFHTDAVQAVGKVPVDVRELDVDFLTLSAHKIYGPKGVGALYIRQGAPFCPLIRGGHQEKGRRAGTENTLGIIGLGKAIELRSQEMDEEEKRLLGLKALRQASRRRSRRALQWAPHGVASRHAQRLLRWRGGRGDPPHRSGGIAVSTGSACVRSLEPSHVLATGCPIERAHGSI